MEIMEIREEYEHDLQHAWMILEADTIYEEDYQMRMLAANPVAGLLMVHGQGRDEKSRYRYDISGKISMKMQGEKEKWGYTQIEEFMKQFVQVLHEVEKYLLDVNCLSLDVGQIYWGSGQFYFCYCPALQGNIRERFHVLTEYFVRETNYEDKEAIYLAYELHKASMEENFNIEQILELILERREKEMERVEPDCRIESYDLQEDMILDDWAGEQEMKGQVLRDKKSVWELVGKKVRRKNRDKWEYWDDDASSE